MHIFGFLALTVIPLQAHSPAGPNLHCFNGAQHFGGHGSHGGGHTFLGAHGAGHGSHAGAHGLGAHGAGGQARGAHGAGGQARGAQGA